MKVTVSFVALLALSLSACAVKTVHNDANQQAVKTAQTAKPEIDINKIDKTIAHLQEQLHEVESLKGKSLEKEVDQFGSAESLRTNINFLQALKADAQPLVTAKSKSTVSTN